VRAPCGSHVAARGEAAQHRACAFSCARPQYTFGASSKRASPGPAFWPQPNPTRGPSHQGRGGRFETSQGRTIARDGMKRKLSGLKPPEIKAKCIETLGQAGAVVDANTPDDAAAFKAWLRQISQHVAEAASEGSWFGLGGTRVSEAEKATLDEISGALRLAA
jgi:hypothetical protein